MVYFYVVMTVIALLSSMSVLCLAKPQVDVGKVVTEAQVGCEPQQGSIMKEI